MKTHEGKNSLEYIEVSNENKTGKFRKLLFNKTTFTISIILIFLSAFVYYYYFFSKPQVEQKVIFEYNYTNYAWGYQNHGWLIDNQGNVKSYRVSSPNDWNYGKDGYISKEDLEKNYNKATNIIDKVNRRVLFNKVKLIEGAANEKISVPINTGNDAGQYSYYCYWWDRDVNKYKRVKISTSGDWTDENLNVSAKEIESWLEKVNFKFTFDNWFRKLLKSIH